MGAGAVTVADGMIFAVRGYPRGQEGAAMSFWGSLPINERHQLFTGSIRPSLASQRPLTIRRHAAHVVGKLELCLTFPRIKR